MNRDQSTGLLKFILNELKPKGKVITPFNIISAIIVLAALVILTIRFTKGLGSVVHPSQSHPWGLWLYFNVITGVAFAGGAYVITFMVYILGMEKYRPIVRPTILYALLAYMFYAGALLLDLGRPWHIINPIIGNSFGISAVLFLIAWKFILYMGSLLTEFFPTIGEWAGMKRQRRFFGSLTLAVVIFGITLSTIHQSGLGALFLLAKPKIHPLWYSEFIPLQFFISSIFAGLSLVIVLESISQKAFSKRMSFLNKSTHLPIMFGLAKTCTVTMFVYFFMNMMIIIQDKSISYLNTSWGLWYLVETVGFVLLPCMLFLAGYRQMNIRLVRTGAVMTIMGIILNRLDVSTIAYKWYEGAIHLPNINELIVSAAVILVQIQMFRWVARRMPVYSESPSWVHEETRFKRLKTEEKSYKLNTKSKKWKISAG